MSADNPWSLEGYKMRFDSGDWFPQNSAEPKPVKSKSYLLMCETRDASKPLPVIRWYRNGRAVRNNRHFYIIVSTPPYHTVIIGSRALALADPYCQSRWNSVCGCVCLSATMRSNISKTKGARRKVTIGSL